MSSGINRIILLGNVGADPELRYTAAGTAVLDIRLATSETYVDKDKKVQERTEWHSVVFWGPRAEALSRIVTKGACVFVEGGIRTSSYEKDGVKRYKTEVHGRELCFTGRKSGATDELVATAVAEAASAGKPAKSEKQQPPLAFEPAEDLPL